MFILNFLSIFDVMTDAHARHNIDTKGKGRAFYTLWIFKAILLGS